MVTLTCVLIIIGTTRIAGFILSPTSTKGSVHSDNFCKGRQDGFYKDPSSCRFFYQCSLNVTFHEPCPAGTLYSESLAACDWAALVPECHHQTGPTPLDNSTHGPGQADIFCKGKQDGLYKDPTSCQFFYQCSFGVPYHEPCMAGSYYSESLQGCDWATNVPECP